MELNEQQTTLCDQNETDFSDLKAVFANSTLQHPKKPSHTALLMVTSAEIMHRNGVYYLQESNRDNTGKDRQAISRNIVTNT